MDYALTLKETSFPALPAVPNIDKSPVADVDDIQESLSNGNFLLIIAGDALDHRAIRLSQMIQSEHFTSTWDLAMVDMNLYHRSTNNEYLLVPELRGIVEHEIRQTMSVTILGACASLDANHNKQALRIFKHIDDSRILRVDGGKGLKQPTLSFYVRSTNEKIGTSWIESKGRDVGFSLLFRSARLLELYNATESQLLDKFRDQGFRTKSSVSKDGYVTVYLPWDTDEKVLDELIGLVTGH
jgi:hypothetical protein